MNHSPDRSHLTGRRDGATLHAKVLCKGTEKPAIMPLSFICKPEKSKKDEGAKGRQPSGEFHRYNNQMIHVPNHGGDLIHAGISEVRVFPANPRSDRCRGGV